MDIAVFIAAPSSFHRVDALTDSPLSTDFPHTINIIFVIGEFFDNTNRQAPKPLAYFTRNGSSNRATG